MRKFLFILALLMFAGVSARTAEAQSRVFYIDNGSGSNSNSGTSTASPWKTAPPMHHGGSCDSGGPTYSHQVGDKFLFKGGVNWSAACFTVQLAAGGTASAQDYWGVCISNADFAAEHLGAGAVNDSPCANGTSWPSTGWTRPTWNSGGAQPAYEPTGGGILVYNPGANLASPGTYSYITFDNLDISNWDTGVNSYVLNGAAFALGGLFSYDAAPGTIVENSYIHDWVSNTNNNTGAGGIQWVGYAVVNGAALLRNSVISDANGHYVLNSTTYNHSFMGGCEGCGEVSNSTIHDGWECTSRTFSTHDTECYNITQAPEIPFSGAWSIHSHVIYDDGGGQTAVYAYNNYLHNNNAGLNIYMFYHSYIFNNVMWNNVNNAGIRLTQCAAGQGTPPCGDSSSAVGWVANNTVDMTNGDGSCFQWETSGPGSSGLGTLNQYNNICIGTTGSFSVATINGTSPQTNYNMQPSEASAFGFTSPNKYAPSSSDSNIVGKGHNLTSSCSGSLTSLCLDVRGATWFGGTYVARTTSWDDGAYQGSGGGGGNPPPTSAITAPTQNQSVSGSSVTLTATCTPGGTATVSNIQFYIDTVAFGAAGTSSPYSLTLDSTKMANSGHTIYSVCTQSDSQNAPAATINFTVSNSTSGCQTSNTLPTNVFSQGFTSQTGTFTATWSETPNSATNDTVFGLSTSAAPGYSSLSALLRANTSGDWDAFNGTTGTYAAVNTVGYAAGTAYSISITINFGASTYSLTVNGTAIATNYGFRAAATSLAFWNLISDQGVYDTAQVCNFQITGSSTLSFSQPSINFGNVSSGSNATQTESITVTGSNVTFTGAAVTPSPFTLNSDTCNGNTVSSCSSVVKFAPVSVANFTGTLCYTDNATGSPQCINLSGSGVAASPATVTLSTNASNPVTSINFNSWLIFSPSGPTATITGTVVNGPATISVSVTGGDASDFKITSDGCTASVSSQCQEVVQYTPHRFGTETTTLAFAISGQATQNVTLIATSVVSTQIVAVPF